MQPKTDTLPKPPRRRGTLLVKLAVLLVFVQVVLPVILSLARNHLVFLPRNSVAPEDRLRGLGRGIDAKVVHMERPDGRRLAAYDARPTDAPGDPVVLWFHGNGGDIAMRADLMGWLIHHTGVRWVMPDYSGYGGNEGSPSESEVVIDGLAAFDWLVASGVDPGRIVLYGESLGGAVALAVATERRPAGIIVQSGFSSLSSMAMATYPWMPLTSVLTAGAFPSAKRLADLEVPVLLAHGERDGIVPISESEKLLAAAPQGTELIRVPRAGHNNLFETAGPDYARRVGSLVRTWVGEAR